MNQPMKEFIWRKVKNQNDTDLNLSEVVSTCLQWNKTKLKQLSVCLGWMFWSLLHNTPFRV